MLDERSNLLENADHILTHEGVPLPSDTTLLTVYALLKAVTAFTWSDREEARQRTSLLLYWMCIGSIIRLIVGIIYTATFGCSASYGMYSS